MRRRISSPAGGDAVSFEEAFRVVRSNLSVALSDLERPTVVVTSPNAEEGKSVTCYNLAIAFAQAGLRVVIVDLDLRNPTAPKLVGGHNEYGVTDVLLGRRNLDECLQYVELPGPDYRGPRGLYFIATGGPVANPTELLGTARTVRMLEGLSREADLILIDTPPVLPIADTLVIARMAAGAILVVEARRTPVVSIQKAKDLLIRNQTRLLGIVLNKFRESNASLTVGNGLANTTRDEDRSANGNGVKTRH
jgi:capsular exopolysaccharide synthesis family protein